jgi:hypothetical protein
MKTENKRDHGGVNRIRSYPCGICGANLESYNAHKRHLSRYHGKSERQYDKMLLNEIEGNISR